MSTQQKKAAHGACFHIPYYQSDQIIQKTIMSLYSSFFYLFGTLEEENEN